MQVSINIENEYDQLDVQKYEQFVHKLLKIADESDSEIGITFVDDEEIHRLNQEYRQVDSLTDVLTFSLREGESIGQINVLGDIVISIDTAKRQAESLGHSLDDEICELIFHGFLHVLGYNHEVDKQQWETIEKSLRDSLIQTKTMFIPKGIQFSSVNKIHLEREDRLT